jgi:hypothetical protein
MSGQFILCSFSEGVTSTNATHCSNSDETSDEKLVLSSKLKVVAPVLSFVMGTFSFKTIIVLLPTFS